MAGSPGEVGVTHQRAEWRSAPPHYRSDLAVCGVRAITQGPNRALGAAKRGNMAKFFGNLGAVLIAGLVLASLLAVLPDAGYRPPTGDTVNGVLQWSHVFFGITWIGLLYYFNFVQIPAMPTVPAELKPGVTKYIAPSRPILFPLGRSCSPC